MDLNRERLTTGELKPPPNLIYDAIRLQQMLVAFVIMSWSAIFAVKASFLAFFRVLIVRVRGMMVYWWCVVGVTAIAFALNLAVPFVECPHFNHDVCMATKIRFHDILTKLTSWLQ